MAGPETYLTTGDTILTTMAGAGYSTMMAAGDGGVYETGRPTCPDPQYPGSDPATTSVGGTQLGYQGDGTAYSSKDAGMPRRRLLSQHLLHCLVVPDNQ